MAKNRSSFGDAASRGLRESYETHSLSLSDISVTKEKEIISEIVPEDIPSVDVNSTQGVNPYYDYHPKTGQKGGSLGRPRTETKRTQISIGCTEAEKELYKKAATADGRKLPDFVNRAILEYIVNHGLDI